MNMKNLKEYWLFFVLASILLLNAGFAFYNWISDGIKDIDEDEYYCEKRYISEYEHIFVIHAYRCPSYDPYIKNKEPIKEFIRHKYMGYCSVCVDKRMKDVLNSYNKANQELIDEKARYTTTEPRPDHWTLNKERNPTHVYDDRTNTLVEKEIEI